MKRESFAVLSTIAIVTMLLLCGSEKADRVTFSVGGAPAELDFWSKLVTEFTENTGIQVEMIRQPTDTDQRRQSLVTALRAGKGDPDVFLMDVAWAGQFAASDWLADLGEYTSPRDLDAFFARVVREADHYDGTLIALPVYIDGGVLYYRTDLLEEIGHSSPPQTWNELVSFSREIMREKENLYGFVWQGAQYEGLICNFLEFAGSNGGGIRIEDGSVHVNSPENREAVELMRSLIHDSKVSPPSTYTEMKEEEVRLWFQQGKAMFERNWPYAWKLHQAAESPVRGKVGIAPLPHFENGVSKSTLGGWHVGISRHSDSKENAWRLVEFMTSRETQKKLALELGWNPGRVEVYTDSTVLSEMPHFAELRKVFDNATARPNVPYYSQLSIILQRHLNSVLAGKKPVDEALATAESEMTRIVGRYEQ